MRLGSVPTVFLASPDVIREAFDKSEVSDLRVLTAFRSPPSMRGLIFSPYSEGLRELQRFATQELFSPANVAALVPGLFLPTIDETVDRVSAMPDAGEPVPVPQLLSSGVYDLFFEALFGRDETQADEYLQTRKEELRERLTWLITAFVDPAYNLLDAFPRLRFPLGKLLARSERQREGRNVLLGSLVDHVEKRRSPDTPPTCLVDTMLDRAASESLGRPIIHSLCMDVLVNAAGLAAAVDWFLLLMANRPDMQTRIQEEMDRVVGRGAAPGEDHRVLLPYTFACLAESMRYRPVSPLSLPHLVTADTEIGGYRVAAGTQAFGSIYSVHHDERFWESPGEFVPERFLPQADGSPPPALTSAAYMPFGTGIRRCAGNHFALSALWLYAVRMLHRVRVDPPDGVSLSEEEVFGQFITPRPYALRATRRGGGENL